ncbi:MAG: CoA transferase [Bacteroidia bacterium]|nr:CoA transferase [Bacteroidia bacterium]
MNLLGGLKIIDFSRMLPGPVATGLLAAMGAEVTKIESPHRMDYTRNSGIPLPEGGTLLFKMLNHLKEDRILNYNSEEGKKEVFALIEKADVVIEQFRPGAMDSWGLGYQAICEINPSVIYVSVTGYGQEGALRDSAGHDINYLAYSGLLSLMKDEKGKPVVPGFQLADVAGGSYMTVIGVLGAVIHRQNTGEGAYLDINISRSVLPVLTVPYSLHKSRLNYREFNLINGLTSVNYAVYECLDGKWLAVGALEMKFWNQLCDVLGRPEWKRNNELELMAHAFDKKPVEVLFKTRSRGEWMSILEGLSVCVAPVLELEELETHPFHLSTGSFRQEKTASGLDFTTFGFPFTMKTKE